MVVFSKPTPTAALYELRKCSLKRRVMPSIELKNHAGKLLETRECVFAVRQPLLYRSQLIILAEYPPTASVCELPYDNASSRYVSNILGETPYDWVDIVPLTTVTELTGNV